MNGYIVIGVWIVLLVLILVCNYAAHRNDPIEYE